MLLNLPAEAGKWDDWGLLMPGAGVSFSLVGGKIGKASPEEMDQVIEGLNEIIGA
jgi:hypothetical protein